MKLIAATYRQLSVGDRVRIGHQDPYQDASVVKVDDKLVHFIRPYVYQGQVGTERWSMPVDHGGTVDVYP